MSREPSAGKEPSPWVVTDLSRVSTDLSGGILSEQDPLALGSGHDGWFMSDGHQILGPYNFEEVIGASGKPSTLPSFHLLSKRGFSEWYDVGDLKGLYHTNPKTQWDSEKAIQGGVSRLSKSWQQPSQEKVSSLPVSSPSAQSLSQEEEKKEKAEAEEIGSAEEVEGSELNLSLTVYSSNPLSGMNQPFTSKTLGHWYMRCKGSLRLGRLVSLEAVLFKSLLTLGVANGFYVVHMLKDLSWHEHNTLHDETRGRVVALFLLGALAVFPVLSGISYFVLAKKIGSIQHQAGARSFSAQPLIFMSLLPFVGLVFLEHQLKRYWIFCILQYAEEQEAQTKGAALAV